MSTILKALRRVEDERPAQPQRRSMRGDIVGGPGKPPAPPPRKRPRGPNLRLWGGLGAALLLAALVWWRLPSFAPEGDVVEAQAPRGAPQVPAPVARAQELAPPPAAVPTPQAPPAASGAAMAPSAGTAAAVPEPAAAPTAAAEPPAADTGVPEEVAEQLPPLGVTLDAPEAAAPPEPAPVAASLPAEPAVTAAPAPTPAVQPAPRRPAARPSPPPTPVAKKPAPAPKPTVAKSTPPPPPSAPAILVERASWHPKPERRVAWVRLEGSGTTRELHEGDAVGTLVVKEIRPSAVVFTHGAEELTRRVGAN